MAQPIRSYDAFRHTYGRNATVQDWLAYKRAEAATSKPPPSNGCDCFDPECYTCDPTGQMNGETR